MNAIEKKHWDVWSEHHLKEEVPTHATITKDTAVGFAEWIRENKYDEWDIDGELRWSYSGSNFLTTPELYDIYIKTLEA